MDKSWDRLPSPQLVGSQISEPSAVGTHLFTPVHCIPKSPPDPSQWIRRSPTIWETLRGLVATAALPKSQEDIRCVFFLCDHVKPTICVELVYEISNSCVMHANMINDLCLCVCVFSKGFENAWNHKYGSSNNREHWILPHTVEYHFFEYLSTTCQHAIETTKAIGSHGMNAVPPSTKLQLHQRPAHQTIHFTSPNPWILWICFGSSFNPSNNTKIQTN